MYIGLNTSEGHQIKAADVNRLTNPGISFAPNIEMSWVVTDTGGQKLNKECLSKFWRLTQGGSNQDYNHDAGERKLELVFDLERSGDGTSETWNSKANTDMTVNIWDTNDNPNSTPGTTFTLNNSDVDTFVIPESGTTSTPNSVGIKLETVLTD